VEPPVARITEGRGSYKKYTTNYPLDISATENLK